MAKKSAAKQEAVTALAKLEAGPLAPWEQEAAAEARADAAAFQQGMARISFKGGHISVDKEFVQGNKLRVIIIDAVLEKAYYPKAFVEGTAATPACYAFHAKSREEMNPHEAAPDKQHETCAGCKHNVFGTAIQQDGSPGKGKRCRDVIRAVALVYNEDPSAMVKGEMRAFQIPTTSLKLWSDYVSRLAGVNARYNTVVTEISAVPFKASFQVMFEPIGKLGEQGYLAVKSRWEQAHAQLMSPYPVLGAEEAKAAPQQKRKLKGQ